MTYHLLKELVLPQVLKSMSHIFAFVVIFNRLLLNTLWNRCSSNAIFNYDCWLLRFSIICVQICDLTVCLPNMFLRLMHKFNIVYWQCYLLHCYLNYSISILDGLCDFEEGRCNWEQEVDDDLDWVRGSGNTPVIKIQPNFDHTTNTDSGHYFYMNSSSHVHTGHTARMFSPLFTAGTLGNNKLDPFP